MITHGTPPFLECSSKGNKRFSAFYAMIDGKSIEEHYQAYKIFDNGKTGLSWKEAKGKKSINQKEASVYYSKLWDRYIDNNPELLTILKAWSGLSDKFGQKGHCCQASELWRIKNTTLKRQREQITNTEVACCINVDNKHQKLSTSI